MALLTWDIYEIVTSSQITGIMFRGRLRKFALSHNITLLTENAVEKENMVRFAVLEGSNIISIENFLKTFLDNVNLEKVLTTQNPVLSKLKVNIENRYTI